MKWLICFVFGFWTLGLIAQDTSFVKIHFWYGSKPAKGFKKVEGKYFGGIHGGHVTFEFNDTVIGFSPARGARIFPKKSHSNGRHHIEQPLIFTYDTTDDKQATVIIPIPSDKIPLLKDLAEAYLKKAPYDYALFGMRCAASAHEFLSLAGIFKQRTKLFSIFYNFYPKKLRKRVYDLAFEYDYEIIFQDGRKERKWEKDKSRHRKDLNRIYLRLKNQP